MRKNIFIKMTGDRIFKSLWQNKIGREWFNELIYEITNIDISSYILKDKEINNKNKNLVMDIILMNKNENTIINIEMNNYLSNYLENKNHAYLNKISYESYVHNTKEFNKIIQININDYKRKEEDIIYKYRDFEKRKEYEHSETIYNIYVENYRDLWKKGKRDRKTMMLALLGSKSKKERNEIKGKEDEELMELLELWETDGFHIGLYDKDKEEERMKKAIAVEWENKGIEQGILKGTNLEKIEIAKNMLKRGMRREIIEEITGLSKEEIKLLKNKK